MKTNKVYIIGAGPIGLVTAWKLLEKGIDVEVFEKNSLVGGMCRTWKWNGFLLVLLEPILLFLKIIGSSFGSPFSLVWLCHLFSFT